VAALSLASSRGAGTGLWLQATIRSWAARPGARPAASV